MAPVLLAAFNFSLQRVAGAALFGTFVTSIVGVALYQFLPSPQGIETRPDWALGALFGLGGIMGMYFGARTQKYVPRRLLELGVGVVLIILGGWYFVVNLPILIR